MLKLFNCFPEADMDNLQDSKLTINKVAELCGVSKTTISRYLNGKYDNMSAETKERIASVISSLDYHPNRSAQRLKSQKAMLIGCVLADVSSPFSAIVLKGIANFCEEAGYHVLFADSREDPARERKAIHGFLENGVDGLLVNPVGGNEDLLFELKDRMPLVIVDRSVDDNCFDTVGSPDHETAYNTTKLLYGMGYKNIAFVSEEMRNIKPRLNRLNGYIAATDELGIKTQSYEFDINNGSCVEFLSDFANNESENRHALICVNGVTALHALMSLFSLDINVGYDFGFITFDDWNWLQIARPSITTIQLGTEEKGIAAAKLLIQRIDKSHEIGEEPQKIVIPSHLILRSSTQSFSSKKITSICAPRLIL